MTDTFGTVTTVSILAQDKHRFRKDISGSDVLQRMCFQTKNKRSTNPLEPFPPRVFPLSHELYTVGEGGEDPCRCGLERE